MKVTVRRLRPDEVGPECDDCSKRAVFAEVHESHPGDDDPVEFFYCERHKPDEEETV